MESCHMCGDNVVLDDSTDEELLQGFECADCGETTCPECKSLAVGQDSDHCRKCRG